MSRGRALVLGLGAFLGVLTVLVLRLAWERPRVETVNQVRAAVAPAQPLAVPLDAGLTTFVGEAETGAARDLVPYAPEVEAPVPAPFRREDLYGTVLDNEKRTGVAGASVLVFDPAERVERPGVKPRALLTTDSDGRFRLVDAGAFETFPGLIQAEGYRIQLTDLTSGRAQEVLLDPAVSLAGRVLHAADRRPAAGVQISWEDSPRWDGEALVTNGASSDAEGRFVLTNVPADEDLGLRLAQEGRLPDLHALHTGTEPVTELELLLQSTSALRLRLMELETGVPLAGFRGRVEYAGPFETDGAGLFEIRRGADRFLSFGRGCSLTIASDSTCTTRVLLPLDELEELHDVPLSRGATIEGRVSDGRGLPVEGAAVSLSTSGGFAASPDEQRPGLPPGVTIAGAWQVPKTDARGAFVLDRLFPKLTPDGNPEPAKLQVTCKGWQPFTLPVEVPPVGATRWIDVVLERGASVHGRVLLDGEPLAGAIVRGKDAAKRQMPTTRCTTNDGGEYLLEALAPGSKLLRVYRADPREGNQFLLAEESVILASGQTLEHDLHVTDSRVAIEGSVRDESGAPLQGAYVFVRGEGFHFGSYGGIRGMGEPSTTSGREGEFLLLVANDPGPLEIVAWRAGAETSTSALPGSSDIELVLPRPGELRLAVLDEEGNSVGSLNQAWWWPAGTPRDAPPTSVAGFLTPRADDRYELELPAGCWDLELVAQGHANASLLGVLVSLDAPSESTVTMTKGTTLELSIVQEESAPPSPDLSLVTADEMGRIDASDMLTNFWCAIRKRELRPSADGTLVASHLAPGPYVLLSGVEGWSLEPQRFDVPDVERHRIELRWVEVSAGR